MDDTILIKYLQGECNDEECCQVETWYEASLDNQKLLEQLYYVLFVGECVAEISAINTETSLSKFKSVLRKERD